MVLHVCFSLCPALFFAGSVYGSVGLLMNINPSQKKNVVSIGITPIKLA